MRQLYPRSLLRLIVLGNVLVALPLLIAIAYVFINMDRVTARGEALTREAALAAQSGDELPEDMLHKERLLRQHAVLKDASLLDDYAQARQEYALALAQRAGAFADPACGAYFVEEDTGTTTGEPGTTSGGATGRHRGRRHHR